MMLRSGALRLFGLRKNPVCGHQKVPGAVGELVGHGLDSVAAVLGDEAFNPIPVIAEKDQVFRATHKQSVNLEDFGPLQVA
jgi:hypothetical protein